MDRQNFAIGCLSVSAVVLLVGVLVLGSVETRSAQASMISSAGTYTLLTGALDPTVELVYLIDTRTEKLAVYRLNQTTRVLERTEVLSLETGGKDKRDKTPRLRP